MRIRLAALTPLLVLLLGSVALGQTSGDSKKPLDEKKPSQLEELLAQALRDNPDVRVAEAKVREADAELNRTRLQVVQKVVAHQHTVETLMSGVKMAEANYAVAEAKLKFADAEFKRATELSKTARIAAAELDAARANVNQARANVMSAQATLQAAKADLAKAQAELPYLLGKAGKADSETGAIKRIEDLLKINSAGADTTARALAAYVLMGEKLAPPQGTVADKLRKALDTTISLKFGQESLGEILVYLGDKADVSIVPAPSLTRDLVGKKLNLSVNNISLGAAFQLLEDVGDVKFAVRDYGIFVTDKLPPGVMPLHDFWKGGDKPKATEEKPKSSGRNPPPGNVEGEITAVDADLELASFSVAKDATLAKGHTLEVYRLGRDNKYLGTLRVENVKDGQGIGRFVNKLNSPVKVGDRLSNLNVGD